MRVLVFPKRTPNNPYFEYFNNSLIMAGMETVRFAEVATFHSSFDVMHFHFPDHVITQGNVFKSLMVTVSVLILMSYAKATRRPIVWMVHDVNPLWVRRKRALSVFMKLFKHYVSGYVFLSETSKKEFYENNPEQVIKPSILTYIGRYRNYDFDLTEFENLKQKNNLGKDDVIVSVLGEIKQRKGYQCIGLIPYQTGSGIRVNLAVCGQVDGIVKEEDIENLLGSRPRQNYVRVNKRIDDREMALWIKCSDAVFLPYLIGSNSSMAINVLSNHGRIISSDIPMFRELSSRFGQSWIKTVDVGNKKMIEDVIETIPIWKSQPLDIEMLEEILSEGDADRTGKRLSQFYNELCAAAKGLN